ncbi:hypothetical protein DRH14_05080 [Candidatus Shapirobacteria bacterium]|nr:MAG: hypothetical protein DRH14_05080 [Candidatus Shapirobacteria bacterium]RLG68739.1 MAG: hypothetical protein DRO11_08650 [Euryarchaeota archaeon]
MKKKMKVSVVDFNIFLIDVEIDVRRVKDKELQVEYVDLTFIAPNKGMEFTVSITMSQAKKLVDILQEIIQSNEQKRGKS